MSGAAAYFEALTTRVNTPRYQDSPRSNVQKVLPRGSATIT